MKQDIEKAIKELWMSIDKLYALYEFGTNDSELIKLEQIRRKILRLQAMNREAKE